MNRKYTDDFKMFEKIPVRTYIESDMDHGDWFMLKHWIYEKSNDYKPTLEFLYLRTGSFYESKKESNPAPVMDKKYSQDEREKKKIRADIRRIMSSKEWSLLPESQRFEFLDDQIRFFPETSLELPALKKELETLKFNLGR